MRNHTKLRAFELADEVVLLNIWVDFPNEKSGGFSSIKHR